MDATTDIIGDPDIEFQTVAGTKEDEFALIIRRGDDKTLILNDILSNVRHPKGLGAQVMARLLGFGVKRPRTSRPVRLMFVKDLPRSQSNSAAGPRYRNCAGSSSRMATSLIKHRARR